MIEKIVVKTRQEGAIKLGRERFVPYELSRHFPLFYALSNNIAEKWNIRK